MQLRSETKKTSRSRIPADPRLRVLNSLRASAEMFRQQGKNPIEVQEALDWEKKLHERIAQIEAESLPQAA